MANPGIHGAVELFADLPPASGLDLSVAFIVRRPDGAPAGAGIYWVVKTVSGRVWAYLDNLDFVEDSVYSPPTGTEDDWAGSPPGTVNLAIARLAAVFHEHLGTGIPELHAESGPGPGGVGLP